MARKLTDHLSWPDDEDDADAWREQWREAFQLRHGEVIDTSKTLSARLAELARAIRDRARSARCEVLSSEKSSDVRTDGA